jgi:hypothetical protein
LAGIDESAKALGMPDIDVRTRNLEKRLAAAKDGETPPSETPD